MKSPGDDIAVYLDIVNPPLLAGAVNDTVAVVALGIRVAEMPVGAPGREMADWVASV